MKKTMRQRSYVIVLQILGKTSGALQRTHTGPRKRRERQIRYRVGEIAKDIRGKGEREGKHVSKDYVSDMKSQGEMTKTKKKGSMGECESQQNNEKNILVTGIKRETIGLKYRRQLGVR